MAEKQKVEAEKLKVEAERLVQPENFEILENSERVARITQECEAQKRDKAEHVARIANEHELREQADRAFCVCSRVVSNQI